MGDEPRDRFGAPSPGGRTSLLAIIGAILAVGSLLLPAIGALVVSAGAVLLGALARRQLKKDPSTGPSWVSLIAIIGGGFVFVSQAVILVVVSQIA